MFYRKNVCFNGGRGLKTLIITRLRHENKKTKMCKVLGVVSSQLYELFRNHHPQH